MVQTVQSSNLTGLSIAKEASLKTLPGTPVWYELEPNSYSTLGGKYTLTTRDTINASRQLYKGVQTDLQNSAGFNMDFTQTNLQRLMEGFFFAATHEKADTQSFNSTAIAITSVTNSTSTYAAASGLDAFIAGNLIYASGFGVTANNGLKTVASTTSGTVVVSETVSDEASPPAAARLECVGFVFGSDDAVITYSGGVFTLSTTTADLTTLDLNVGEWVFLGGDSAALRFVNNQGYARIKTIATNAIVFDKSTFTPVSETTTSKTVQIFFGKFIRNELTTSLIVRTTYQIERQLGEDTNGTMSEYLTGSVADQLDINIKEASKIDTDLKFVCCGYESRDGATEVKSGTRVSALGESALNTVNNVYAINMSIVSTTNPNPTTLFGYVSDAKITISNGVKEVKAIQVLGAWDTVTGNFNVSGNVTVFFTTVDAVAAIQNNSDVDFQLVVARANAGWVFDIPLLALGGGLLNVAKDQPITVPLENSAARNTQGYTTAMSFFNYLPTLAMPT